MGGHAQRLSDLRNLGPKSLEMLATIGITTIAQLTERGALETFIALKQAGVPVSLNMLWALEGALSDRDWREVMRAPTGCACCWNWKREAYVLAEPVGSNNVPAVFFASQC